MIKKLYSSNKSDKKNLLIVSNDIIGLYKFRKELIVNLVNSYNVNIVIPNDTYSNFFLNLGCKLHNINISRRGVNLLSEILLIVKLIFVIMKVRPLKVISYTIKPNIYIGFISLFIKFKFYPNITGLGFVFQKKSLTTLFVNVYRFVFRKSENVFFENNSNLQLFIKHNIVPFSKCILLNGAGVNTKEFKKLPFPKSKIINFLYCGRIMKEKGIDELIDAISMLNSKFKNIFSVTFVGSVEEKKYTSIISDFSKSKSIRFFPFNKNLTSFFIRSHCIVLPSYHEGMSNILLEGGSSGRPLIATNIPGCREIIKDGSTGFLVEKASAIDLFNKMAIFLKLTYSQKKYMGELSRRFIKLTFDKKNVVANTLNVINKL